jgi:hypothetical protein
MKTFNVTFENQVEEVTYNGVSMTPQEAGLGHTDITDIEEVIESLIEVHGDEEVIVFVNGNAMPMTCKVLIDDLEDLGWDFSNIFQEVSDAQKLSLEDAEKWEKEHYHVKLRFHANGAVDYYLCQNAEYGNEDFAQGDCGDNEAAQKDLQKLISEEKIWSVKCI